MRILSRWAQAVVDIRRLLAIFYLPRYIAHWCRFQRLSGGKLSLGESYPCLSDWVASTPFDPHYFFQSAWLCRQLQVRPPADRHVDIGSDVRMIAAMSAFVPTDFIDFRPLQVSLANLHCLAGNITALPYDDGTLDSVSSLHVVEHVGLGRYGDLLDAEGSTRALAELSRIVAPGGVLYLSVPVGRETVCFNAHRVFDPETIVRAVSPLTLQSFALVNDENEFLSSSSFSVAQQQHYGCGMFVFKRP
jgi:SAM-dependent methyltransferase